MLRAQGFLLGAGHTDTLCTQIPDSWGKKSICSIYPMLGCLPRKEWLTGPDVGLAGTPKIQVLREQPVVSLASQSFSGWLSWNCC